MGDNQLMRPPVHDSRRSSADMMAEAAARPGTTLAKTPDGLRMGDIWLLAMQHDGGVPAATAGRAIDHIAFAVANLDPVAGELERANVQFLEQPGVPEGARTSAKRAMVDGPDHVSLAVVEAGFAGVVSKMAEVTDITTERRDYTVPRTPWGHPDFQGSWENRTPTPLERDPERSKTGRHASHRDMNASSLSGNASMGNEISSSICRRLVRKTEMVSHGFLSLPSVTPTVTKASTFKRRASLSNLCLSP